MNGAAGRFRCNGSHWRRGGGVIEKHRKEHGQDGDRDEKKPPDPESSENHERIAFLRMVFTLRNGRKGEALPQNKHTAPCGETLHSRWRSDRVAIR